MSDDIDATPLNRQCTLYYTASVYAQQIKVHQKQSSWLIIYTFVQRNYNLKIYLRTRGIIRQLKQRVNQAW